MRPLKIFNGIKSAIAFLTIVPVGMESDCWAVAADHMYLFPLVGALIGFLGGLFAWLLRLVLPDLIAGMLTLGFLLLITRLHHTDGLLDFGDGLMSQGPPQEKIKIMHDQRTGAGGLALGSITLLTTALCIAELNVGIILLSLLISEISAKLAMVLSASAGRSAHGGMNTPFVEAMHGRYGRLRLTIASIISFGLTVPLLRIAGSVAVIAGMVTSLTIVWIANRHFGGVTGDVFGATNELARMVSLIAIMVMVEWA